MSDCNHDCSSCGKDCKDRNTFLVEPKESTKIDKMIAIVSGKGGVGKSLITSMLAVASRRKGKETAIFDADITGPSIPRAFGLGLDERAEGSDEGLFPVETKTGIKVMSINLLLEDESMPVVWRGPVISGVVKQFYTDVLWNKNDIMFIDMPPGTGDVPLTVFQSLPIDGIIVVTTPQDLVGMIVEKAVNMAKMMNIPILGIVENMSYAVCPKCGEKLYVYGESNTEKIAEKYGLKVLAKMPIVPENAKLVDQGKVEDTDTSALDGVIEIIEEVKRK